MQIPSIPPLPEPKEYAAAFATDKLFPVEPGEAVLAVFYSSCKVVSVTGASRNLEPDQVLTVAVSSTGHGPLAKAFKRCVPAREWGDHLRVLIYRLEDHKLLKVYKQYLEGLYNV